MNQPPIFHLAIPIGNIADAKQFYCDRLGCVAGRESKKALILNFYGHQMVGHVTDEPMSRQKTIYPRHFGLIFPIEADWEHLLARVKQEVIEFCFLDSETLNHWESMVGSVIQAKWDGGI